MIIESAKSPRAQATLLRRLERCIIASSLVDSFSGLNEIGVWVGVKFDPTATGAHMGMDDAGAVTLACALTYNHTLQSISLENEDDSVSPQGCITIARMLERNAALQTFCFSSRALDDDVCVAFAGALEHNSTLRESTEATAK